MDEPARILATDLLTEPQRVCLRLVATHHNSKEIAYLLGVSPSAVDKRIERAVQVLGARSRFAAARALAANEGGSIAEPEPIPDHRTSDRLPWDAIDLPATDTPPPNERRDEPWWLVRRLLGLSSLHDRVGGRTRNDLTMLQRLGLIMAVTLFVAVSSVAVLNMAVTLSGIVGEHRPVSSLTGTTTSTRRKPFGGTYMLKERRNAVDTVAAHFLMAETAADEAAMLTSECVSTFMRQRVAANLPVGTGTDALQLLSDAATDLMRGRQRLVEAHRALVEAKGAIGLRAYGDEGCPPSAVDERLPVKLTAVA